MKAKDFLERGGSGTIGPFFPDFVVEEDGSIRVNQATRCGAMNILDLKVERRFCERIEGGRTREDGMIEFVAVTLNQFPERRKKFAMAPDTDMPGA